jgi:hypothetical protein
MTEGPALWRLLWRAALAVLLLQTLPLVTRAETVNCVQFVKRASPVALSGDAYAWWDAAAGRYGRGTEPRPGSVMVFEQSRRLPHGHVALVQQQLDQRTLLIDHANWSRIQGRRGRIERAVRVVDVSRQNDWSEVRVWYHSLADVGQSVYRLRGFVYPRGKVSARRHR